MDNSTNTSTTVDDSNINFSSSHNIWFGITGFLTNSLSVSIILMCKSLLSHQKISMLSLVFNDLVFMASVTVYGVLPAVSQLKLVRRLCWPLVYLTLATHTVTFMTICHMTITSYLAVFKPLRFRILTSKKKTLITVICIWIVSWVFVLICIRFDLPIKEKGCSLHLLVSGVGWITWVSVPIVCACLVTVINLKILWFLHGRKKRKVAPRETVWKCDLPGLPPLGNGTPAEELWPQHSSSHKRIRPPCNIEKDIMDELPQMAPLLKNKLCLKTKARIQDSSSPSTSSVQTVNLSNQAGANLDKTATFNEAASLQRERFLTRNTRTVGLELLAVPNPCGAVWTTRGEAASPRSHNNAETSQIAGSHVRAPASLGKRHLDFTVSESSKRLQKATITLLILTISSCFLTLPEVVFCLVLAIRPGDKENIASSDIGKFVKLCLGINILMNPALYCWRLIQWGKLRRHVVSKCRALGRNRLLHQLPVGNT